MDLTDGDLAAALAGAAGRLLREVRGAGTLAGEALGQAGDAVANQFLCRALRSRRPADGLLSEEEKDGGDRLARSRVWIVDPVDGTREYREGRADWAVHVGLAVDGVPALGAVALPDLGLVLRSDRPGALPSPAVPPRMAISRTRPPAAAVAVATAIGARLLPMGSAGAKAMAVVRGEAEAYLHVGGQYEWDSCAPAAVAIAHGLHVSRADGTPLRYNRADPYLPDLLICRAELAGRVLDAYRAAAAAV